MNTPPPLDDSAAIVALKKEIAGLAAAVKIGFLALLFVASWFNIRLIFHIHGFASIFHDMLGNAPLPADTEFVFHARTFLMVLACAMPAAGIVALFAKGSLRPVLTMSILLVISIAQTYFTWNALIKPLFQILQGMTSGPPGSP